MLAHLDADNGIKFTLQFAKSAVVHVYKLYWQALTVDAAKRELLLGHTDANHAHSVLPGGIRGEGTKAAADIQEPHSWPQSGQLTEAVHLPFLGGIKRIRRAVNPQGGAIHHARTEH